jgi:hypothetical protein
MNFPQTTTVVREKATLSLIASEVSTATAVQGDRTGIGGDTDSFASIHALLATGYLSDLS